MASLKPAVHGKAHAPWGSDPSCTERWHHVGDLGEPALLAGTGDCWFKIVVGPPGQELQSIEQIIDLIAGSFSEGDVLWVYPADYIAFIPGVSVPWDGHDLSGNHIAGRIIKTDDTLAAGSVVVDSITDGVPGPTGPAGPAGPAGPQGVAGADGADGADGSVWHFDVGDPDPALGVDGDFFLDTATGNVWTKVSGTWELAGNLGGGSGQTTDGATFLVSGGGVSLVSGLTFEVAAATYLINGTIYSSATEQVTLDPADATNDRIDAIVVDDTGHAAVVTGTPAATPAHPDIDPSTQLELTFVVVPAAATTIPTVTTTYIYQENAEWTSSSSASIDPNGVVSPYAGSKDIDASAATSGNAITFLNGSLLSLTPYQQLVLHVWVKAAWPKNRSLSLAWLATGAAKGRAVSLTSGSFGFDSQLVGVWQTVVIPLTSFSVPDGTQVNQLRISVGGSGSSIGFRLDDIALQGGLVTGGGGSGTGGSAFTWRGTWSSTTAYAPNDVVFRSGSSYIALQASTNQDPTTATAFWALMAQKGDTGATGAAGADGADGADGTSFTWRDAWSSATAYAIDDVVSYSGSSYIAIASGTNHQPDTSPTFWSLMAEKGADGTGGGSAFTWEGVWSSATAYAVDDVVSYSGSSYIAIAAGTNHQPDTSPTFWSLMAQKGDTGATGATGDAGSDWDAIIVKSADESVTASTTLQTDDELQVALVSGGLYELEFVLVYASPGGGGSPDLKVACGEDATLRGQWDSNGLSTSDTPGGGSNVSANQSGIANFGTAATKRLMKAHVIFWSAGGTFAVLWAQLTSNANATIVYAGSTLRYRRVA